MDEPRTRSISAPIGQFHSSISCHSFILPLAILTICFLLFFLFDADSIKTDAQRAREKKLLDDLVQIVDKRDELVRHLDNQEKA